MEHVVDSLVAVGGNADGLTSANNAYALWIEATEAVQKYGAMIKSPNGYPSQSPYLAVVNRQADTMMRIASEFGFTPASRSRIFSFTQKNSLLLDGVDEPDDGSSGW